MRPLPVYYTVYAKPVLPELARSGWESMWQQRDLQLAEMEPEMARIIEQFGYQLVLAQLKGPPGGQTLTLYIDKVEGVSSEECAQMLKRISVLLETLDPDRYNYNIVVSSPGLERPLTKESDFDRFAGEKASLTVQRPEGKATLTGRLRGLRSQSVALETNGDTVQIPLGQLRAAHLLHDWDDEDDLTW